MKMSLEKKKRCLVLVIILLSVAVISLLGTYAYYVASVGGSGNTTNNQTSVTAVDLGSIFYDGVTTFTGTNLYPGQKFVQEFKIGPNSDTGIGTYEIDLEGVLPSEFGSDVTIRLYKTTDKTNNNVVRTEGSLVQSNGQYYQEDTITVNGTPELVYDSTLTNSSQIILEQADFDVTTMQETTYYLVYDYANNGNQDAQQGKIFNSKVTVRLVQVESGEIEEPWEPNVKYAVSIYGIEEDTYSLDDGVTTHTAGLTFGPATGKSYITSYKNHTPSGTTTSGNVHRCVHDDDWETIIYWSEKDPYVYEQCLGSSNSYSCTKSVPLALNNVIGNGKQYTDMLENQSADGASVLFDSINSDYKSWNFPQSTYSDLGFYEKRSGTNRGGWPDSAIRNTLNGVITDNMLNITNKENGFSEYKLDENTALISCFPNELKSAIVPKAVKSDTIYNDVATNNKTTYDKLWLFSVHETWGEVPNNYDRINEGNLYSRQSNLGITWSSSSDNACYDEVNTQTSRWLRSIDKFALYYVFASMGSGGWHGPTINSQYGLSPGFVLR